MLLGGEVEATQHHMSGKQRVEFNTNMGPISGPRGKESGLNEKLHLILCRGTY